MIHRLPSIKDNFFDYHDQWYQHVRFAQQLLPDSIFILGNEDEGFSKKDMKWSNFTTSIPAALEPQEGCITVADSQFCMPVNAYLSLSFIRDSWRRSLPNPVCGMLFL